MKIKTRTKAVQRDGGLSKGLYGQSESSAVEGDKTYSSGCHKNQLGTPFIVCTGLGCD